MAGRVLYFLLCCLGGRGLVVNRPPLIGAPQGHCNAAFWPPWGINLTGVNFPFFHQTCDGDASFTQNLYAPEFNFLPVPIKTAFLSAVPSSANEAILALRLSFRGV